MRLFTTILMTLVVMLSAFAQENDNKIKEGSVIEMDDLMFRYRIFDYKSDAQEWGYKGDRPCIIDFYATWCAPCRMIAPSLKELAEEYKDSIFVYKVDVDKQKELSRAMGIQSMPTILLIPMKGSPQVIVGAADKNTFRKAIEEVLLPKKE